VSGTPHCGHRRYHSPSTCSPPCQLPLPTAPSSGRGCMGRTRALSKARDACLDLLRTQVHPTAVVPATVYAALRTTAAWRMPPKLATTHAVRPLPSVRLSVHVSAHHDQLTVVMDVAVTCGLESLTCDCQATALPCSSELWLALMLGQISDVAAVLA
jgi:hypothetical protein